MKRTVHGDMADTRICCTAMLEKTFDSFQDWRTELHTTIVRGCRELAHLPNFRRSEPAWLPLHYEIPTFASAIHVLKSYPRGPMLKMPSYIEIRGYFAGRRTSRRQVLKTESTFADSAL
jgi:hypothetical protein